MPWSRAPERRPASDPGVVLVSHSRDLAGAELCLVRLAQGMALRGIAPLVVVPAEGPLSAELRASGVEVAVLELAWWTAVAPESRVATLGRLRQVTSSALALRRLVRARGAKVVGTISSVIPGGALAARLAGARHVWHVRELYPTALLTPVIGLERMLGLIERLSAAVVVPTRRVAALFAGSAKVSVIPEGIDRRYFDEPRRAAGDAREAIGIARDRPAILVAGTVEPAKGQLHAVHVLAALGRRGIEAQLVLCGNTPNADYRREIERSAADLGVAARVHLLGFQRDLVPLYDAASALLVASRRESFGLTIAEAMARGVPVVATRSGGPEELVADRESGFLVPVGDEGAMADRLHTVLVDPARAERLGRAGRERAVEYHPDANLTRTLSAYGLSQEP